MGIQALQEPLTPIFQYSTMELLYPSLFLTLVLLLLFISPKTPKKLKLPPGPWQLPVIGSLHHLIGSDLPHHCLRDLARIHGPIMHLKLGEIPTIVISSPDAAREIMKTHDVTFATHPLIMAAKIMSYGGKGLVFAPYGEFWRELRKVCVLELFSARRVQSFQSIRQEEAIGLVRSISESTVVNLTRSINSLVNDITTRAVIGSKCADRATFLSVMYETIAAGGGFNLADLFPSSVLVGLFSGAERKLERLQRKLDLTIDGIIEGHRERRAAGRPADDLLDALLRLQEEAGRDAITDETLKAVIFDIFAAGSETSATALGWAMAELVRHPRIMKRAQSEIRGMLGEKPLGGPLVETDIDKLSYLKLVIKETIRLHVPLPLLIPRECLSLCEVLGYEIPAKARVIINAWAIARDPTYWGNDAEEFRPERFEGSEIDYKGTNFEFIPFGSGRRICPGMSFGVATVEHALVQLLCYFDWELPGGSPPSNLDMSETFGVSARKKLDLYLTAIPYIPYPTV